MSLRVIGAGLGRTGTMSLKLALERLLGARCYHMVEVFANQDFAAWTDAANGRPVDWTKLLASYQAAVDWPSAAFWQDISAVYPDAIILLSTRTNGEEWWASASETIFNPTSRGDDAGPMATMIKAIFGNRFTPNYRDRGAAIAAYDAHNAHVRATAPRGRLVDWKPGDGWAPLAAALRMPVPSDPFPHVNTTAEFKARVVAGPTH